MSIITDRDKRELHQRASALPVPSEIRTPIVALCVKWAESSGVEWMIQRFKSILQAFIALRAGEEPVTNWIKRSRGDRYFKGQIGALEYWALQNDHNFGVSVQLLRVYTFFVADQITQDQLKKFEDATQASPVAIPDNAVRAVLGAARRIGLEASVDLIDLPKPLLDYRASPKKRAPSVRMGRDGQVNWFQSVPENEGVLDSLQYLATSEIGQEIVNVSHEAAASLLQGIEPLWEAALEDAYLGGLFDTLPVGRVSFIQEPGYKLRYIANPGRVYQRMLEPLGDALFGLLNQLPWDCTFDQRKAVGPVQEHLRSNRVVHCVDLSAATDYFPLSLQEDLLKFICRDPHHYIDVFVECSRGTWGYLDNNQELRTIQWTKGQPLGLYPSFASFALTHGLLLLALLDKPWEGEFYVLGDDVIILDDVLHKRYRQALDIFGCPYSPSKSVSGNIGEFAGYLILPDSVIPKLKWRRMSDDNFIDIARLLGPKSKQLFRPRQLRVLDHLAPVPEQLGGLGWNPEGLPLEERIPLWAILDDKQPRELEMDPLSRMTRVFYDSELSTYRTSNSRYSASASEVTLDQRAVLVTKQMLGPSLVPMYTVLGKNVDKVSGPGKDPRLPIAIQPSSNTSQLSHWESVLEL